jgi:hypothetical protein
VSIASGIESIGNRQRDKKGGLLRLSLPSDTEFLYHLPVNFESVFFEIVQKTASFTDQLHQTVARMVILRVGLQVFGQLADPCRKKGYLNFDGTRVFLVDTKVRNNALFFLVL